DLPDPGGGAGQERPPIRDVIRAPNVARCVALVIVAAATLSMIEPIAALHLSALGSAPARIGLVFGAAALTNSLFHPLFGRLGDRFGARTMTIVGLIVSGCVMPLFSRISSFESALA